MSVFPQLLKAYVKHSFIAGSAGGFVVMSAGCGAAGMDRSEPLKISAYVTAGTLIGGVGTVALPVLPIGYALYRYGEFAQAIYQGK